MNKGKKQNQFKLILLSNKGVLLFLNIEFLNI